MKSIVSASILAFAALFPLSKAWPTEKSTGYTEPEHNTELHSVNFECGDDVPNWVIDVGFGTPNQPASLLIDTTFYATFVAGVMCHSEFCEDQRGPLYNAGKSSTSVNLHQNVTFDLGNGEIVKSDIYKDVFNFGDFSFDDKTFGKAYDVQGFPPVSNYAGVFGMSLLNNQTTKTHRKRGTYSPWVVTGVPRNGRRRRRDSNINQCALTYGIDTSLMSGEIAWLNFPTCKYGTSPFWKTDLTCVTIGDAVDLKFKDTVAEFDTTVKNIEVPHEDIKKIHQGLHATYDASKKDYTFKCCDAKDLKISFAEYTVSIPPSSWTHKLDNIGELCSARISISNTTIEPVNRWRLGTSFITNFFTVFDSEKKQTGLALLMHGNEELHISSK